MKTLHKKYLLLIGVMFFLLSCILVVRIIYNGSLKRQVAQEKENLNNPKVGMNIKNESTMLSSRQIKSITTNDKIGIKSNNDNLKAESQTNNETIDSTIREIIPKIEISPRRKQKRQ